MRVIYSRTQPPIFMSRGCLAGHEQKQDEQQQALACRVRCWRAGYFFDHVLRALGWLTMLNSLGIN
jgi:hypothetical protein